MSEGSSFLPRFNIAAAAAIAGLTFIASSAVVQAQAQTPAVPAATESTHPGSEPAPSAETDIGRVSTGAGQGENVPKPVVASPTINRADAISEKQQAPNLIDVQPLSEIVKLPDINTAEALQRIPGISLETDSGEGRFVHIRGLDADLNGTTYGGVRLPASNQSSPSGGGRTWMPRRSAARSISCREPAPNTAAHPFSTLIWEADTNRCANHRCITWRSARAGASMAATE